MSEQGQRILAEALALPPTERAELLEELFGSFEHPQHQETVLRWREEAEDRIDAYERGELRASTAEEVFERIDRTDLPIVAIMHFRRDPESWRQRIGTDRT